MINATHVHADAAHAQSRTNRRPPIRTLVAISLAACIMAVAFAGRAAAAFNNQTRNEGNIFATAVLASPADLASNPGTGASGDDVRLAWSSDPTNAYVIEGWANGATSNCAGASYSTIGTTTGSGYVDNGRYLPQGNWFCYRVRATYGGWTSATAATVAVQIGFVANSLAMSNDRDHSACSGVGGELFGQAGVMDCGDQIAIGFNQAVDTATGPSPSDTVCVNGNAIFLASPNVSGACTDTETVYLGTLVNGNTGDCRCRFTAGYIWSNGNRTLTVTIGARVAGTGYPYISSSQWTLWPTAAATKMRTAVGGLHICDTTNNNAECFPRTLSPVSTLSLPRASVTPTPSPTPRPAATPSPTASPTPRVTPMPSATASPTVSPTPNAPTPAPTAPVRPTATPTVVAGRSSPTPAATPRAVPPPGAAMPAPELTPSLNVLATPNPSPVTFPAPTPGVRPPADGSPATTSPPTATPARR